MGGMAWLRVSDTAGNNPIVLQPLTDPTPPPQMDIYLWTNALFGLVGRCATSAAGYGRSYFVTDATIAQYAGPQWRTAAEAAERAGYWTRAGERGWQLIDDSQHLFHIRTGEEIDWERARKADVANPKLVGPVRLRDGDGCRYCGRIVRWGDSKSARGGTYDHRVPGQAARTPDDLLVACRGCNSQRGNDPDADKTLPPRPAPVEPVYGPETAAFLADRGYTVPITLRAPQRPGDEPGHAQRPGSLPDTAHRDPAPGGTPHTGDPTPSRTTPTRDPAAGGTPQSSDRAPSATPQQHQVTSPAISADSADRRATEAESPGRDGTGRAGSGSGREGRPRRGRRGKDHRRKS